jgi:hypothetical protein
MDHLRALRLLGLPPGSSSEDIHTAWLDLARVWHPDRFTQDARLSRKAGDKLSDINAAYDALRDYDPEKTPGMAARMRHSVALIFTDLPRGPIGVRNSLRVLGLGAPRVTGEVGTRRTPRRAAWIVLAGLVIALLLLLTLARR